MKIIKRKDFGKLQEMSDHDLLMDLYDMMDCRLQGGVDHIERTKNQIKIFDIGISTGSTLHDQSCIIRKLK